MRNSIFDDSTGPSQYAKQPVFKCSYCSETISHVVENLADFLNPKLSSELSHTPVNQGENISDITDAIREKYRDGTKIARVNVCTCNSCNCNSLWVTLEDDKVEQVYPAIFDYPAPHKDMTSDVKEIYIQAGKVLHISPGASAALSRVTLEKLLFNLGYKQNRLVDRIGAVISSNDLSTSTHKLLDVIRYFGNEGAHTGTINLSDEEGTALYILNAVNDVVDDLITKPNNTNNLFSTLPQGVQDAIKKRDQTT